MANAQVMVFPPSPNAKAMGPNEAAPSRQNNNDLDSAEEWIGSGDPD